MSCLGEETGVFEEFSCVWGARGGRQGVGGSGPGRDGGNITPPMPGGRREHLLGGLGGKKNFAVFSSQILGLERVPPKPGEEGESEVRKS